jgi:periplasmic divalent cation tolerance protein
MQDCKEFDVLSVTTTLGSRADALRLAHRVIERRLAACVQVEEGLTSVYRWQGEVCEEPEVRLVIKTLPEHAAALHALLAEVHPYDLPQFLAVRMTASGPYANWVRAETSPPAG